MNTTTGWVAAALAALLAAGHAPAQVVGVNFVGANNGGGASVTGTAGVVPQANWNNEAANSGSSAPLVLGDGTSTSATLTWSSNNNWATGQAGQNQNGLLMQGYLDNLPSRPTTITLSNVPASIAGTGTTPYDVIVYVAGDAAGRGGDLTVNGVTQTVVDSGPAPAGTFTLATAGPSGVGGTQGNYALFTGVTGTTLAITATPTIGGANMRLPIDGFQVSPVPEPSTTALLAAAGGLGCLARRRRQPA